MEITYRQLVDADAAFVALLAVKGLSAKDKMAFARAKRAVAGDRADIEAERVKLAEKYASVGMNRLKAEARKRADAIEDPTTREAALSAAEKIEMPQGVLQPELQGFMGEFNDLLEQKVVVEVTPIPASKVVEDEGFTADHLFALDWLIYDDVSDPKETQH